MTGQRRRSVLLVTVGLRKRGLSFDQDRHYAADKVDTRISPCARAVGVQYRGNTAIIRHSRQS